LRALVRHCGVELGWREADTKCGEETMRHDNATVRATTVFGLLGAGRDPFPVSVELRYDASDPFAVVMDFHADDDEQVEWTFARDLLAEGLISDVGLGDVRISPAQGGRRSILIELMAPGGRAVFEASASDVARFLERTHELVMPGEEPNWMSVDGTLARVLE
jgi:hypothetical protein